MFAGRPLLRAQQRRVAQRAQLAVLGVQALQARQLQGAQAACTAERNGTPSGRMRQLFDALQGTAEPGNHVLRIGMGVLDAAAIVRGQLTQLDTSWTETPSEAGVTFNINDQPAIAVWANGELVVAQV